ncbi:MAG: histidinol-phosphate transaminase, partial [Actinomycetia bacterium]|nr:histidinol-phosphate transaminase [Actinomycetes bacterium]
MSLKAKKWIMDLPEYIPGRTIEEIKEKYGLKEVYKMASNENLYGLAPGLAGRISKDIENIYYYPEGDCSIIRDKIGKVYDIPAGNIIIGSGSDQIIEMICDSFVGSGDNVVIADPTFPIYEKAALKCGGSTIKVPLSGFRQDIKGLVDAVDNNTKILFLTNPQNPTGTNITADEFDYVMDNLDSAVMLVMDEAYYEYCPADERVETTEFVLKRDNLMLLRTFSKIFGLAGLRIGYGIGSAEAIGALNKVRLPFNVNSIAQKAAVYALDYMDHIEEISLRIYKQRQIYYDLLDNNNIDYVRSYTNFILINAGENSMTVIEELLKNGFIVRPGENLGFPGYIRVTIASDDVNTKFLEVFTKVYK